MVDQDCLTQGGVYLAKLDPSKAREVGKIRPVVVLTTQRILSQHPPIVFICPLSSRSYSEFEGLHVTLPPRDGLKVVSFALPEHCRAITTTRLLFPRLAQLNSEETKAILHRLYCMTAV